MPGHGRPYFSAICAVLLAGIQQGAPAETTRWPDDVLEDAELFDVQFVDAQRGWVVGDRGVVWHTNDSGQHWQRQTTGVDCRLESICFLDDNWGWLVGGFTHRYTHRSTGVVLRTQDGGRRWTCLNIGTLPALHRIKMFDRARGWAVGTASTTYPAGVFWTEDGGRSWSSLPVRHRGRWTTGDFSDPLHGIVAGRDGALAAVDRHGVRLLNLSRVEYRQVHQVKLVDDIRGWLVGDGGLVMTTADGGQTWQKPPGNLPEGIADQFDFLTVEARSNHCWVAGSPGTQVLHSDDSGRSWQVVRTGQNLPLRRLAFADARHGWVVGALGTVLSTRDGGRTWRRCRGKRSRAALIGLFSHPSNIPLELFARLSAEGGYVGMVEILNRQEPQADWSPDIDLPRRTHEAVVAAGASRAQTSWRFPTRDPRLKLSAEAILREWDRSTGGQGAAQLEEHAVRVIRQWRPDVVVTHDSSPDGSDPAGHLISQIMLSAVEKAADPSQFRDQASQTGLVPWQVKKVFGTLKNQQGAITLSTAQMAPGLGRSLADQADLGRALLSRVYVPADDMIGFRLLATKLPRPLAQRDFFSGIALPSGGEARRTRGSPSASNLAALKQSAQQRRLVQKLLEYTQDDAIVGAGWLAQLGNLTLGLDPASASDVYYQLAQQLWTIGEGELAAETFRLLLERCANHPLAPAARTWLIQYDASSETARQARLRNNARRQFPNAQTKDNPDEAVGIHPLVHNELESVGRDAVRHQRLNRALACGKVVQTDMPTLYIEPEIRFPLAVAYRGLGLRHNAQRWFRHFTSSQPLGPWTDCTRTELWLTKADSVSPKRVLRCASTDTRPHLDGSLDDAAWQGIDDILLTSVRQEEADEPAVAKLAWDRQFLYVAYQCRRAAGASYPTSDGPRRRDDDLASRDRIDLMLDLDRDYVSFYRLTIDYRGWTGESCFGSRSWNPEWYVAARQDEAEWTVEAAIPLDQLVQRAPSPGDVWAVGLQRIIPGVGFQSWTQPAAVEAIPEGFGVLVFE